MSRFQTSKVLESLSQRGRSAYAASAFRAARLVHMCREKSSLTLSLCTQANPLNRQRLHVEEVEVWGDCSWREQSRELAHDVVDDEGGAEALLRSVRWHVGLTTADEPGDDLRPRPPRPPAPARRTAASTGTARPCRTSR